MIDFSVELPHNVSQMTLKEFCMPRGLKGFHTDKCARCENKITSKCKYCRNCQNAYMKEWRKSHPLSDEQKFRRDVRRKTGMRIKRGLLIPLPCEVCGNKEVEAHHDNYKKTYDIKWLCFKHHREHHINKFLEGKKHV